MVAERWRRISLLYHEARARADEERRVFLDSACGDDASLRQELDELLADETRAAIFLAEPAAEAAGHLVPSGPAVLTRSLEPATTLGSYRLERLLGRGGMGAVFLAYDMRLCRRVALKVLEGETDSATSRTRLLREARNAAVLNHPHIGTIHEAGEANGTAFIAMEYVGGQSLRERIDEGALLLTDALRVGIQAAEALAYAHDHGVIHRDFKAANVILTEDGQLKVVDFGLARRHDALLTGATTMASLVPAGAAAGTPYAMAPEQVRGEPADARTDLWALGVLLYELVTGMVPFTAATVPELFSSILTQPPAALPGSVPVELRALIERCLEKEPARRYQDAGAVRTALEAIEAGTVAPWVAWGYHLRRRPGWTAAMTLVAAAAVLVGVNVGGVRDRLAGTPPAPPPIKLAVLPFENLTGDPEQEYLSDGLTEEMIGQLGRLHPQRLSVIARTSSMQYKGRATPLEQIGRELGVDYLLEGSARREGSRVRINATLVNVADRTQRWSESFNRELSGILALQHDVARGVARSLALALLPEEQARLAGAPPVNPEAYEAYLRGTSHVERLTSRDLDIALEYFELALEKDPMYALAYVGIGGVWSARQIGGLTPPHEATPMLRAANAKALELDDTLPEVHFRLAGQATWTDWNWSAAEPSFQRAIDLNPSFARARAFYSHYLHIMRRPDEAMIQAERARELDPLNPMIQGITGGALMMARRYDEALAQCRSVLRMVPDSLLGLACVSNTLHYTERYEEALAAERQLVMAGRGDRELDEALTQGYADAGYAEAMRRVADTLAARALTVFVAPDRVARYYMRAGEHERALDWLERSFEARDPSLPYISSGHKDFDALRDHPRFQALLRRMNLPM